MSFNIRVSVSGLTLVDGVSISVLCVSCSLLCSENTIETLRPNTMLRLLLGGVGASHHLAQWLNLQLGKVGKHQLLKSTDILVGTVSHWRCWEDFYADFLSFFLLFLQPYAEDVLHNILLQSIHHHETDRKQVRRA